MPCAHCGCIFCPDEGTPDSRPQLYCSEICGKYVSRKRTGRKTRERRSARQLKSHQRSCPGKIPYMSVAEAGAVLLRMRYQAKGMTGGVYECLACGRWHVHGDN